MAGCEHLCRTVLFPIDLLDLLSSHAARRGISDNELARRIVETVIDDDIVDAVLDDKSVIENERGANAELR